MLDVIVKYRYVITMSDRYKDYDMVLKDWLYDKFGKLYLGKLGFLVCPFFFSKNNKERIYCQLLLDIEGTQGTEKAFKYSKELIKRYPFLTMEYTGKTGFHLASNFLVELNKSTTQEMRNQMLDHLVLTSLVDKTSSVRNMPTIRIGSFGKRFAFPVPKNMTYKQFSKIQFTVKDFSSLMSKQQLENYIREFILPSKIISYRKYVKLI